jgi:hypothetical protein
LGEAKAAAKAAKAKAAAGGVAAAPAAVAPAPVVAAAVPKNKKVGTRAARALRRELFDAAVERRGVALD